MAPTVTLPPLPLAIELQPPLLHTAIQGNSINEEIFFSRSVPFGATAEPQPFPDGGFRAWSVVLGSFTIICPTFGLVVSAGILQSYWGAHQLLAYTSSSIGWIISVNVFLSLALAIQVGPLFDRYGPRVLLLVGSLGYVASLLLLAQCAKYWHFMVIFGIVMGACSALLTTTAISVISHWFQLRRGFASGVAITGTSIGGVIFPLILKSLLYSLGWMWTMRVLALVVAVLMAVGNLCIRARLMRRNRPQGALINLTCFRDSRFVWATVGLCFAEFCFFGPLGLLPTYALSLGFSIQTSFNVIAVLNGASAVGRFYAGYISDIWGRFNSMLLFITFSVLTVFCFWMPISTPYYSHPASAYGDGSSASIGGKNVGLLYTFSVLFGLGSGSIISLTPVCIGQLCSVEQYGRYYGTSYSIVSIADLICVPIGGALLPAVGPLGFVAFFGGMLALSLGGFGMARWASLEYKWKWRVVV